MVVGLTGGIACGKSTAAEIFRERGFGVVDCDAIVRELLVRDESIRAALRRRFGARVIAEDGGIDRAVLADLVFSSPRDLEWLEGVLHPEVNRIWGERTRASAGEPWVVQIPLLFEKSLEKRVDLTVCVASNPRVQWERLRRRGISECQAKARMSRQMPLEAKMELADYVVLNDGALGFLREQVLFLVRLFRED